MNEHEKNKLLQEAGKRRLTPEEQEKLDNWYAAFDVSGKDLQVFHDNDHEEKVRQRLLNNIIAQLPETGQQPSVILFFLKPHNWMKVAAVLAFFIICFSVYNYIKGTNERMQADTAALNVSTTQAGTMLKVTLEDGSEIWLNSGSEIKYPKRFDGQTREVALTGEAFFNIVHNPAKPFIVKTGRLKTTVLGTSFNVRAYPGLDHISVNVATGKVGITASGKTLCLLTPNQQISFHTVTGSFKVTETSALLAQAWRSGVIRLDGASFKELSLVMKNTWGITLETHSSKLLATSFKTTFNANNKIDDVMKTISKMTAAKYRIRNQVITLYE